MLIFPAIDLSGGRVVRLYQGDYDKMTVYGDDPVETAHGFMAAGADCLHAVDLDAAKSGGSDNFRSVRELCGIPGLFVEVGGGIRSRARIEDCLECGAGRVILGTAAVRDFDFTARMAAEYGDKIAVGVDARNGRVAVSGWTEESDIDGIDFCRRLRDAGVKTVIYTDISRDGAEKGANIELYKRLAELDDLAVTASGGIGSIAEIRRLRQLGVAAAVLGKALYTGRIDLAEAIIAAGEE